MIIDDLDLVISSSDALLIKKIVDRFTPMKTYEHLFKKPELLCPDASPADLFKWIAAIHKHAYRLNLAEILLDLNDLEFLDEVGRILKNIHSDRVSIYAGYKPKCCVSGEFDASMSYRLWTLFVHSQHDGRSDLRSEDEEQEECVL